MKFLLAFVLIAPTMGFTPMPQRPRLARPLSLSPPKSGKTPIFAKPPKEALAPALSAFTGFLALSVANKMIFVPNGLTCVCPPLGAVAVLLFSMPSAPASQPKAVIFGNLLAGLVSFAVLQATPVGVSWAAGLSVALTILMMGLFGVTHPPAGAYAYFYTTQKLAMSGIFAPGLAGAIILVTVQKLINKLTSFTNKPSAKLA